jgi:lipopolysaccharide heptosyltransferase II
VRNNILVITLSNIGDVILTLPAIDLLRNEYTKSNLSILAGERTACAFENNPKIKEIFIYNKLWPAKRKLELVMSLRKTRYDLLVDFRNSFFPFLLKASARTSPLAHLSGEKLHLVDKHIAVIRPFIKNSDYKRLPAESKTFHIPSPDLDYVNNIVKENALIENQFIIISAGSRSELKRWPGNKFSQLGIKITDELKIPVVLVGAVKDCDLCKKVLSSTGDKFIDLSGKTSLAQLAALMLKAKLLITNDSGNLHLASYFNVPVVAVFGPTDATKSGPWGAHGAVAQSRSQCAPCNKPNCQLPKSVCMEELSVEEVFAQTKQLMNELQTNISN